ncbi:MAG TPA: DUF5710 domain-containing protein, partial [Polyangiales bacterium]|nr:DUF5710 domain-containing protein [Polyangiales bacterium]
MSRIDLFVAPEDYPEVKALGACWDRQSKCWYIEAALPDARFAAWLPDAQAVGAEADEFLIQSAEAFVASARTDCHRCRCDIQVVCLYCRHGTVCGEPLHGFRVQCLWAVDGGLREQLQRWPAYRMDSREGAYLNHCPHCGAPQNEADLHEEPGRA